MQQFQARVNSVYQEILGEFLFVPAGQKPLAATAGVALLLLVVLLVSSA